mgnify:CR=1 FL=1
MRPHVLVRRLSIALGSRNPYNYLNLGDLSLAHGRLAQIDHAIQQGGPVALDHPHGDAGVVLIEPAQQLGDAVGIRGLRHADALTIADSLMSFAPCRA